MSRPMQMQPTESAIGWTGDGRFVLAMCCVVESSGAARFASMDACMHVCMYIQMLFEFAVALNLVCIRHKSSHTNRPTSAASAHPRRTDLLGARSRPGSKQRSYDAASQPSPES